MLFLAGLMGMALVGGIFAAQFGMSSVYGAQAGLSVAQISIFVSSFFIGAIIAMIAVLFVGSEIKGAQRWIRIFGFSLQPSEFVKPAFLVVSAWMMTLQKEEVADVNAKKKFKN